MAWYDVEAIDIGGVDGVAHVGLVNDTLIDRAVDFLDVHTQTARRVSLRVGVDDQHRLFKGCQRGCQIDGGRGFAYATLLVC